MRIAVLALVVLVGLGPDRLAAQQEQTLADIRQELTVLNIEIQRLRRELSTTGAPGVPLASGSVLDRVVAAEAALKRLTERTEQMGSRIERIVADGTNRIGDLEFRLVELEGGDVGQLGETSTLGGDVRPRLLRPTRNLCRTNWRLAKNWISRPPANCWNRAILPRPQNCLPGSSNPTPAAR